MKDSKQNTEFVILKKSFSFSVCSSCDGTGIKKRMFRKMVFAEDCPICKGEGRKRHTITEEVQLTNEILKSIQSIK